MNACRKFLQVPASALRYDDMCLRGVELCPNGIERHLVELGHAETDETPLRLVAPGTQGQIL